MAEEVQNSGAEKKLAGAIGSYRCLINRYFFVRSEDERIIMPPKVSVVIPTYNRAAVLVEAIESVLAQTWKNLEIIVVDDGSTDNTRDVLAPYRGRIRYIFQPNSGGCSRPKNVGVAHACSKYIAFLDDDDLMGARKIETQVSFLERNPDVGMVFTDFSMFANGEIVCNSFIRRRRRLFFRLPRTPVSPNEYILFEGVCDCLALETFIGTPSSVMARKAVLESVGLFDERVDPSDDIDMWFRIARKFPIGYIDVPLSARRLHDRNLFSLKNEGVVRNHIRAREKFLRSRAITEKTRGRLSKHLGAAYFALADLQLSKGRAREARFNLFASVRRRPFQIAAYRLLCASLLPTHARVPVRKAYRAVMK